MPNRNTLAVLALAASLIAAPAFADGKERPKGPKGPAPLKAQPVKVDPVCETGTGYYDAQGRFVCPVITRVVERAPEASTLNLAGLTGGVGAGVGSGFYGGGEFIAVSGGDYNGVLSHPAAAFTFNRRVISGRTAPPPPPPRPPCGCS